MLTTHKQAFVKLAIKGVVNWFLCCSNTLSATPCDHGRTLKQCNSFSMTLVSLKYHKACNFLRDVLFSVRIEVFVFPEEKNVSIKNYCNLANIVRRKTLWAYFVVYGSCWRIHRNLTLISTCAMNFESTSELEARKAEKRRAREKILDEVVTTEFNRW